MPTPTASTYTSQRALIQIYETRGVDLSICLEMISAGDIPTLIDLLSLTLSRSKQQHNQNNNQSQNQHHNNSFTDTPDITGSHTTDNGIPQPMPFYYCEEEVQLAFGIHHTSPKYQILSTAYWLPLYAIIHQHSALIDLLRILRSKSGIEWSSLDLHETFFHMNQFYSRREELCIHYQYIHSSYYLQHEFLLALELMMSNPDDHLSLWLGTRNPHITSILPQSGIEYDIYHAFIQDFIKNIYNSLLSTPNPKLLYLLHRNHTTTLIYPTSVQDTLLTNAGDPVINILTHNSQHHQYFDLNDTYTGPNFVSQEHFVRYYQSFTNDLYGSDEVWKEYMPSIAIEIVDENMDDINNGDSCTHQDNHHIVFNQQNYTHLPALSTLEHLIQTDVIKNHYAQHILREYAHIHNLFGTHQPPNIEQNNIEQNNIEQNNIKQNTQVAQDFIQHFYKTLPSPQTAHHITLLHPQTFFDLQSTSFITIYLKIHSLQQRIDELFTEVSTIRAYMDDPIQLADLSFSECADLFPKLHLTILPQIHAYEWLLMQYNNILYYIFTTIRSDIWSITDLVMVYLLAFDKNDSIMLDYICTWNDPTIFPPTTTLLTHTANMSHILPIPPDFITHCYSTTTNKLTEDASHLRTRLSSAYGDDIMSFLEKTILSVEMEPSYLPLRPNDNINEPQNTTLSIPRLNPKNIYHTRLSFNDTFHMWLRQHSHQNDDDIDNVNNNSTISTETQQMIYSWRVVLQELFRHNATHVATNFVFPIIQGLIYQLQSQHHQHHQHQEQELQQHQHYRPLLYSIFGELSLLPFMLVSPFITNSTISFVLQHTRIYTNNDYPPIFVDTHSPHHILYLPYATNHHKIKIDQGLFNIFNALFFTHEHHPTRITNIIVLIVEHIENHNNHVMIIRKQKKQHALPNSNHQTLINITPPPRKLSSLLLKYKPSIPPQMFIQLLHKTWISLLTHLHFSPNIYSYLYTLLQLLHEAFDLVDPLLWLNYTAQPTYFAELFSNIFSPLFIASPTIVGFGCAHNVNSQLSQYHADQYSLIQHRHILRHFFEYIFFSFQLVPITHLNGFIYGRHIALLPEISTSLTSRHLEMISPNAPKASHFSTFVTLVLYLRSIHIILWLISTGYSLSGDDLSLLLQLYPLSLDNQTIVHPHILDQTVYTNNSSFLARYIISKKKSDPFEPLYTISINPDDLFLLESTLQHEQLDVEKTLKFHFSAYHHTPMAMPTFDHHTGELIMINDITPTNQNIHDHDHNDNNFDDTDYNVHEYNAIYQWRLSDPIFVKYIDDYGCIVQSLVDLFVLPITQRHKYLSQLEPMITALLQTHADLSTTQFLTNCLDTLAPISLLFSLKCILYNVSHSNLMGGKFDDKKLNHDPTPISSILLSHIHTNIQKIENKILNDDSLDFSNELLPSLTYFEIFALILHTDHHNPARNDNINIYQDYNHKFFSPQLPTSPCWPGVKIQKPVSSFLLHPSLFSDALQYAIIPLIAALQALIPHYVFNLNLSHYTPALSAYLHTSSKPSVYYPYPPTGASILLLMAQQAAITTVFYQALSYAFLPAISTPPSTNILFYLFSIPFEHYSSQQQTPISVTASPILLLFSPSSKLLTPFTTPYPTFTKNQSNHLSDILVDLRTINIDRLLVDMELFTQFLSSTDLHFSPHNLTDELLDDNFLQQITSDNSEALEKLLFYDPHFISHCVILFLPDSFLKMASYFDEDILGEVDNDNTDMMSLLQLLHLNHQQKQLISFILYLILSDHINYNTSQLRSTHIGYTPRDDPKHWAFHSKEQFAPVLSNKNYNSIVDSNNSRMAFGPVNSHKLRDDLSFEQLATLTEQHNMPDQTTSHIVSNLRGIAHLEAIIQHQSSPSNAVSPFIPITSTHPLTAALDILPTFPPFLLAILFTNTIIPSPSTLSDIAQYYLTTESKQPFVHSTSAIRTRLASDLLFSPTNLMYHHKYISHIVDIVKRNSSISPISQITTPTDYFFPTFPIPQDFDLNHRNTILLNPLHHYLKIEQDQKKTLFVTDEDTDHILPHSLLYAAQCIEPIYLLSPQYSRPAMLPDLTKIWMGDTFDTNGKISTIRKIIQCIANYPINVPTSRLVSPALYPSHNDATLKQLRAKNILSTLLSETTTQQTMFDTSLATGKYHLFFFYIQLLLSISSQIHGNRYVDPDNQRTLLFFTLIEHRDTQKRTILHHLISSSCFDQISVACDDVVNLDAVQSISQEIMSQTTSLQNTLLANRYPTPPEITIITSQISHNIQPSTQIEHKIGQDHQNLSLISDLKHLINNTNTTNDNNSDLLSQTQTIINFAEMNHQVLSDEQNHFGECYEVQQLHVLSSALLIQHLQKYQRIMSVETAMTLFSLFARFSLIGTDYTALVIIFLKSLFFSHHLDIVNTSHELGSFVKKILNKIDANETFNGYNNQNINEDDPFGVNGLLQESSTSDIDDLEDEDDADDLIDYFALSKQIFSSLSNTTPLTSIYFPPDVFDWL